MAKTAVFIFLFFVFCCLVMGCTPLPSPLPTPIQPTPTLLPPPSITPAPTIPPASPPPDTGWTQMQTGLERRTIRLFNEEGQQIEQLYLLRIDPAFFTFQIAYSPGQPKSLPTWQAETGALIVVNGGFFTEAYEATGLIVIDGAASGVSYGDFAGMFAITEDGPDVRWLAKRPYSPTEPLQFALQSFPMLVQPGGQVGFPDEDDVHARRTVVAEDRNGRILFILAPQGSFTLHQMSQFLVKSDLDIDTALNLDGGTSTGLTLADPKESVMSFTAVPAVIIIFASN